MIPTTRHAVGHKKTTGKHIVDADLYLAPAGHVSGEIYTWMMPLRLDIGSRKAIRYHSCRAKAFSFFVTSKAQDERSTKE
jgi:hypothetical protein